MSTTYTIRILNVRPEDLDSVRAVIGGKIFAKTKKSVDLRRVFHVDERFRVETLDEMIDRAAEMLDDAYSIAEDLSSEMSDWYENLPESFQSGEKGDALQEAQSALDEIACELSSPASDLETISKKIADTIPALEDDKRAKCFDVSITLNRWMMKDHGISFNIASLRKALAGADAIVTKSEGSASRADRLYEAKEQTERAVTLLRAVQQTLVEDLANTLEDEIEDLDNICDALEGIDMDSVEFPGMY